MESINRLKIDYVSSSASFERAMKKFQLRKIIYKTLFRGKGLEFDGYRSFDPSEDYNSIDWKASLRAGQKMVKQYKEERDVSVYFLVDCSKGMLFGSGTKLKAEYAGEIVCALANLVLSSGDKAGLIMYSSKDIKFLEASNKKNQLFLIHKFLSDINNYIGSFDLEHSFEFAFKHLRGESNALVLVSDFIHIRSGFEKKFPLLKKHADFFGLMIRDKMDEHLPNLNYTFVVQDPSSERKMIIDSNVARKKFYENSQKQKKVVKELFNKANIDLLELKNEDNFVLSLSNFMRQRAEELRL